MDTSTIQLLQGLATGYFTGFTVPVIQKFFSTAFQFRPSLENDLRNAKSINDFEKVFNEAVGVIDAQAGNGFISIDGGFLNAIRGIRFDHNNGTVFINGSTIKAPILQTGGTNGIGQTTITNANLNSQGTEIQIGSGASIIMTGGASIRQN